MQRKTIQILSLALFILLLFWGGYTLLYYLGVPVHGAVLLPEAAKKMIQETCAPDGLICRGWHAFFPYIFHTIARAQPFLWYGVLSAIGYALFLGWRGLTTGQFYLRLTLKPWNGSKCT